MASTTVGLDMGPAQQHSIGSSLNYYWYLKNQEENNDWNWP